MSPEDIHWLATHDQHDWERRFPLLPDVSNTRELLLHMGVPAHYLERVAQIDVRSTRWRRTMERLGRLTPRVGDVYAVSDHDHAPTLVKRPRTRKTLDDYVAVARGHISYDLVWAGPGSMEEFVDLVLVVPKGYVNPMMTEYRIDEMLGLWTEASHNPTEQQLLNDDGLLSFEPVWSPYYVYVGPYSWFNSHVADGRVSGLTLDHKHMDQVALPTLEEAFPRWCLRNGPAWW